MKDEVKNILDRVYYQSEKLSQEKKKQMVLYQMNLRFKKKKRK
jgi:hypothetical protein